MEVATNAGPVEHGKAKTAFRLMGASNHADSERQTEDYYATDPSMIDELLKKESFNRSIWEPACGQRSLSRRLEEFGYEVRDSDIVARPCDKPIEVLDFMQCFDEWEGDIITNPPYGIALEFIQHALGLVKDGSKVAMFLRLLFLEGKQKYDTLFLPNPPKAVYVCSKRALCAKNADFGKYESGSFTAYAWFVWQKGYKGKPALDWINVGKDMPKEEALF